MLNSLTGRLALGGVVVVVALLAGLAVWGTVEAERASRPLVGGLDQADGQLDAMRTIGRLHAALDAYGESPRAESRRQLTDAEQAIGRAIAALERERSLTSRELALDIFPLMAAFGQKRRDHWELLRIGRRRAADAVYLHELQPLLASLQESIDRSIPDPMLAMRRGLASFERRERLVRSVTAVAAPASLFLLALCASVLRAYRRRLRDREQEQLVRSRQEATTDALTGLGNRRKLLSDLEQALAQSASLGPRALLLFDLDGFKAYNDTFGHPAGDSLLQRVAEKLRAAVVTGGAYRLGGDEFCVLTAVGEDPDAVTFASAQALSEQGDGFRIGSSWGRVLLHEEADNATAAMQIADRRMYTQKNGGRHSANRQTRDVLLATLAEREPELGVHLQDVAELADNVGRLLGLSPVAHDELKRAAELHDIGKVAIPDSILDKPGTLSPDEWAFMRRHTLIGERILLAAPAMAGVARLVRSHHEFFDGTGYPDALSGEDIPLGARIIAVCDAFHAMTHTRVYRDATPTADALAELARCAGSQFDPAVVAAIVAVVGERSATPA